MTVYVLEADCMGVFASLDEAKSYPFEAGLIPLDAPGTWQQEIRDGQRVWALYDKGNEVCAITEQPLIGWRDAA